MPVFRLTQKLFFPPAQLAEPDGLLAIGGDLSAERLLLAYQQGIFPWYDGPDILWWCPQPRFVLFPSELQVSKSMQQVIKRQVFDFTINQAFPQVISRCRTAPRKDQPGTWISGEVQAAYIRLHELGYAHSAEAWQNGELAGGLYGVQLGNVFFGESMFSQVSNASKYAFISYIKHLQEQGTALVDCQVYTAHLESLGARMIDRKDFLQLLEELI